jgi:hypothetical protein
MSQRLNYLLLSQKQEFRQRSEDLAKEFDYSLRIFANIEQFSRERLEVEEIQFVLMDALAIESGEKITESLKALRSLIKGSFLCVVVDKDLIPEPTEALQKAGANLVLFADDIFQESRLEYISSQVIRASYVPVKLAEFPTGSVLDFTLYHLLPLNQKLLPILPKGSRLSEERRQKLEGVTEVYIRRDEIDRYRLYVEARPELLELGLRGRCRAQYLSFCNSHAQLIFFLCDRTQTSGKEGKWLFDRCEILAKEMVASLSAIGEAWDVVNNSSLGEFGSVERSPSIAAYAGLLSLSSSLGEPVEVMMTALLAAVGMLRLPPLITKKIRQSHSADGLNDEEREQYQKYPQLSLEQISLRKVHLPDSVREMILNSNERGKKDISAGAMLIQFSEIIDQEAMVRLGRVQRPVREIRRRLIEQEMTQPRIFTPEVLQKIKPLI